MKCVCPLACKCIRLNWFSLSWLHSSSYINVCHCVKYNLLDCPASCGITTSSCYELNTLNIRNSIVRLVKDFQTPGHFSKVIVRSMFGHPGKYRYAIIESKSNSIVWPKFKTMTRYDMIWPKLHDILHLHMMGKLLRKSASIRSVVMIWSNEMISQDMTWYDKMISQDMPNDITSIWWGNCWGSRQV